MIGLTYGKYKWTYKGKVLDLPQDGQRLITFLEAAFIDELQDLLIAQWVNGGEKAAFMTWARSVVETVLKSGENEIFICSVFHSSTDEIKTKLLTKAYNHNNYELALGILRGAE